MERVPLLASRKEQRAAIRFFWAIGLSTAEIHNEMQQISGDKCFNLSADKSWCRQFSSGRTSLVDDKRSDSFFAAGIEKLVPRWDKCLKIHGGYVEN